jgi:hypothetical protein
MVTLYCGGSAVLGVGGLAVLFRRQRSATGSTGQVGYGGTRAGNTAPHL